MGGGNELQEENYAGRPEMQVAMFSAERYYRPV